MMDEKKALSEIVQDAEWLSVGIQVAEELAEELEADTRLRWTLTQVMEKATALCEAVTKLRYGGAAEGAT